VRVSVTLSFSLEFIEDNIVSACNKIFLGDAKGIQDRACMRLYESVEM
jgi:hypothetical protein